MDNGDQIELSKQILQSQKTHAIANYKKYCDETAFEGLSNKKLFDILSSLKPAQPRALADLNRKKRRTMVIAQIIHIALHIALHLILAIVNVLNNILMTVPTVLILF